MKIKIFKDASSMTWELMTIAMSGHTTPASASSHPFQNYGKTWTRYAVSSGLHYKRVSNPETDPILICWQTWWIILPSVHLVGLSVYQFLFLGLLLFMFVRYGRLTGFISAGFTRNLTQVLWIWKWHLTDLTIVWQVRTTSLYHCIQ